MKNNKHEFYESRSVFLVLFLISLFGNLVSIYMMMGCPVGLIYILFFTGGCLFALFKCFSTLHPYIIIDSLKIEYKGQHFLWSKITKISLTRRFLYTRKSSLYLKLESGHQEYWIDLKFVSDKMRRSILDAVACYMPVHYEKCKYESNEQTVTWGLMVFCLCFVAFALLFYTYMQNLMN